MVDDTLLDAYYLSHAKVIVPGRLDMTPVEVNGTAVLEEPVPTKEGSAGEAVVVGSVSQRLDGKFTAGRERTLWMQRNSATEEIAKKRTNVQQG